MPGRSYPGAIKLASNETTQGPLPGVAQAIADAASVANRYPDNTSAALIRALSESLGVPSENIATGCGSVALCQELVQATCNEGDEVVYAWRSFEAYPVVTKVAGAVSVPVPLTPEHGHDLDAMLAAITDRTRLIFVCNPNNPTGTALGREELERFLDAVPARVVVALDEAYFEYNRSGVDGIDLARTRRNVVVLRTFSKAYGLAALRVGYAVADPAIIAALAKVHITFSVTRWRSRRRSRAWERGTNCSAARTTSSPSGTGSATRSGPPVTTSRSRRPTSSGCRWPTAPPRTARRAPRPAC